MGRDIRNDVTFVNRATVSKNLTRAGRKVCLTYCHARSQKKHRRMLETFSTGLPKKEQRRWLPSSQQYHLFWEYKQQPFEKR